jgi:FKBP-type peptidyl-prolyl cis-trans isomerase (trigger factor)
MKQQTEVDLVNFYEIAEGEGSKAFCGQQVSLQIHKMSGGNILPFQTSDVTLEIGRDKLSLGVIGMKEGGERVVLVNDDNKNVDSYYVKLIEVKNKYPESINNLMIFDNLTNKFGKKVKCGDEISIKYSIRKHNGELQIENQAVQFKVGDKKVPLAIELGVIGMRVGNSRTIISPPDVLTIDGNDDMFDEENISIIDLSL